MKNQVKKKYFLELLCVSGGLGENKKNKNRREDGTGNETDLFILKDRDLEIKFNLNPCCSKKKYSKINQ
jgi:hypothetical protein